MSTTVAHRPASLVEVPRLTLTGLREDAQHILLWQARGETRLVVEGTPLSLSAGTALWIPARTEHRLTTAPNSALLPMFFDARRFPAAAPVPTVVTIDAHAETLCLALIGSHYSLVQPTSDLEEMVLALVEAQVVSPADTVLPLSLPALRIARHLLLDPADQRGLAAWAAELHLSTRTLERQFLAETGMTWLRWRHTHRMLRAAQLLRTTPLAVTEIARRVGFDTPSAFARAFRAFHQTTPTQLRAHSEGPSVAEARFRSRWG